MLANTRRNSDVRPKPFSEDDFMPSLEPETPATPQTKEQQVAMLRGFADAMRSRRAHAG